MLLDTLDAHEFAGWDRGRGLGECRSRKRSDNENDGGANRYGDLP